MSVTIKREIVLRSVVTDRLKKQLADELQRAAAEIEQRVLKPLEDQCAIIENVTSVSGAAQQNVASLGIYFAFSVVPFGA